MGCRVFLATPTTLSYDNRLLCMFTPVLYKLTKDLFFKANFFSTQDAVAFLKKKTTTTKKQATRPILACMHILLCSSHKTEPSLICLLNDVHV